MPQTRARHTHTRPPKEHGGTLGETASNSKSTFHLFPRLPQEVRHRIWSYALPSLKPSIYFYRRGCWRSRHVIGPEKAKGCHETYVRLKFHCDRVRKTWFEVAMVSVNHEARQVALDWAQKQALQLRCLQGTQRLVFLRQFVPDRDALCVIENQFNDFLTEVEDFTDISCYYKGDLTKNPSIKRLIISESLLKAKIKDFHELVNSYHSVETLYIITTPYKGLGSAKGVDGSRSLEYKPSKGISFSWDLKQRSFNIVGDFEPGDRNWYFSSFRKVSSYLADALSSFRKAKFEVVPVGVYWP